MRPLHFAGHARQTTILRACGLGEDMGSFAEFPSQTPFQVWGLFALDMGGCQNDGPFWGTLNMRCRTITGIQKRDHNFDNHPHPFLMA